jgi:hypothetical protein
VTINLFCNDGFYNQVVDASALYSGENSDYITWNFTGYLASDADYIRTQDIRKRMGELKNAYIILVMNLFVEKGMHSSYFCVYFQECLIEMLQEMFGEDSVPKIFKGEKLYVTVDGKKANIDLLNLVSAELMYIMLLTRHYLLSMRHHYLLQEVCCEDDEVFQQIVQTAVSKLYQSLAPPRTE